LNDRSRRRIAGAGLLAPLLLGCAARTDLHLGEPTPEQASLEWERVRPLRPWASLEGMREGRSRYVERCGSCHSLPDPSSRTVERWTLEVERMAPKAHLDSLQGSKITDWLASRALAADGH